MEHVISMEFHSRKVERKEAGESSSRDNDQTVIVAGDTHKLTIIIQERGSTSSKEDKFKKLKEAEAKVQLGTTPKIREVLMLRGHKHYRKYCEPRVVSLGPIHHGKPAYQLTEEYKLMLADKFIEKTGRTDKELYGIIQNKIEELRQHYDEKVTQKYSDEDLAWMLFVDGCATLQFIDSIVNGTVKDFKIKNDQVAFVQQDLFLLENQLPYQLLDYLMKNIKEEETSKNLRNSIRSFINMQGMQIDQEETKSWNDQEAIHLLDSDGVEDKSAQEKVTGKEEHSTDKNGKKAIHLLDLLRKRLLGLDGVKDKSAQKNETGKEEHSTEEDKSGEKHLSPTVKTVPNKNGKKEENTVRNKNGKKAVKDWQSFRNVQELREVGIQLKSSPSSCLGDIKFTRKWHFYPGILELPAITVDDSTGPKFFNLIAYEMCPDFDNDFGITSYISFLDSLIDEPKDVIDLRKAEILRNLLGSDEEVAKVFNEIGTDLVPNPEKYEDVRVQIQKYYDMKSMTWISEVTHTHFSSPWTVIAFLAALFVLALTVIQTVYSILAYYNP